MCVTLDRSCGHALEHLDSSGTKFMNGLILRKLVGKHPKEGFSLNSNIFFALLAYYLSKGFQDMLGDFLELISAMRFGCSFFHFLWEGGGALAGGLDLSK